MSYIEKKKNPPITESDIVDLVYTIRGQRVLLDRDLGILFNSDNRKINQQVKIKAARFGGEYSFKLKRKEFLKLLETMKSRNVVSNWKGVRYPPTAFTEKGIYMLAIVLRSDVAALVSKHIIEIFTDANKQTEDNKQLQERILYLEKEASEKNDVIKILTLIAKELNKKS